jgi:hypothetical protein
MNARGRSIKRAALTRSLLRNCQAPVRRPRIRTQNQSSHAAPAAKSTEAPLVMPAP